MKTATVRDLRNKFADVAEIAVGQAAWSILSTKKTAPVPLNNRNKCQPTPLRLNRMLGVLARQP